MLTTQTVVTATKIPPTTIAITRAEWKLLLRMRQVRRERLADAILVNIKAGTLYLVKTVGKSEKYDVTCQEGLDTDCEIV
jgi:hypothetical protein